MRAGHSSRTVFVGNLPENIRKNEIKDLFYKYGRILDIDLRIPPRRRAAAYCYLEFESSRAAEDAIRGRDGYDLDDFRMRVEYSNRVNSNYRVIVRGLPDYVSWPDLKDYMRKAGDVYFAQVHRDSDGTFGLVDYTNYGDMKYAIRKLDDTEFKNRYARSYIRVKQYERSRSRSRSRSISPRGRRGRSPTRSRSRNRSASPVKASSGNSRSSNPSQHASSGQVS